MEMETEYLEKIESNMSWRNMPPKRRDYDTEEEYGDALDAFFDALEAEAEERMMSREE